MSKILIKNGLLIDTEWKRRADILITGSTISKIAPNIECDITSEEVTVIHADGLLVLPGIIDAHTHYHLVSRGTVTADSFKEGSRAAAFGGVTTVVDFADDRDGNLAVSLKDRVSAMKKEMCIDFALHQGVYKFRETLSKELDEVLELGVGTIKLFTTYKNVGYMIDNKDELKEIIKMCRDKNIMVSVHCEDDEMVQNISDNWKGTFKPADHAELRPSEVEAKAIRELGVIVQELGASLYIVHLSSKAGLIEARKLREQGVDIILETTPHYLFLDKTYLADEEKGPLYVMTPPLRSTEDNEALQEALCNGEIQVVATDHCAFAKEQKLESDDCRTIYPGIPGSEEMLPLIHTLVANGALLTINELVNVLSTGPAKKFGLYPQKGTIQVGSDADLVIFDSEKIWKLTNDDLHSNADFTPYEGTTVVGKAVMTLLRGRTIVADDTFLGIPGDGRFTKAER